MKILYIIPSLKKGGGERLVLNIYRELMKRENVNVRLITFSEQNDYSFLSQNILYEVISSKVVPSISGKGIVQVDELLSFIKDFKPDIIHSHLFEAEIISRWKLIKNIAYVTHCHDNMKQFRKFSLKTLIKKELFANFYEKQILIKQYKKCNNHFIVISKDTEQYFRKTLQQSLSKNIHFLPNAINFNIFNNSNKTKAKLDKNAIVKLISVGSLVDKKNQIFFIDVVKLLHEKKIKVQLELLGEGPNKKLLEKKILDNNLKDFIFLKGNISNVEDYFHHSSIYVHAASYEPFGLALLEAMAAGLPVVCLDGKGNRDIIEQGKNGFMVYEKNAELFAGKIIDLIENEELYHSMSVYAVEFARKYDIKEYVDKLLDIYNKSLNV